MVYLGEQVNWHAGFGVAGVGMLAGVIQYRLSVSRLGEAGLRPSAPKRQRAGMDKAWYLVIAAFAAIAIVVVLGSSGILKFNALALAQNTTYVIVGLAFAFFVYIFAFGKLDTTERKHMIVIVVLAPMFAAFWVRLARRQMDPSMPVKFAFGLIMLGLGFLIMVGAAKLVTAGNQAAPYWLIQPTYCTLWASFVSARLD